MQKFHWVLDNGHGFNTPGKRSPYWNNGTQLFEYEYNRAIVGMISAMLTVHKIEHTVLVNEIEDISLRDRVERIHHLFTEQDKVLVSVHGNAAGTPKAKGFEVFTSPGQTGSDPIATVFSLELEKEFPEHSHRKDYSDSDPDKEAEFYVLTKTRCRAILTENEFFTNPEMCALMLTVNFRKRVALAHVRAILKIENGE